jgi:hypothetical protein
VFSITTTLIETRSVSKTMWRISRGYIDHFIDYEAIEGDFKVRMRC